MAARCSQPLPLPTGTVHCRSYVPPSLGQCWQLEELVVWGNSLPEVTQVASPLTQLARLIVKSNLGVFGATQVRLVLQACAPWCSQHGIICLSSKPSFTSAHRVGNG